MLDVGCDIGPRWFEAGEAAWGSCMWDGSHVRFELTMLGQDRVK